MRALLVAVSCTPARPSEVPSMVTTPPMRPVTSPMAHAPRGATSVRNAARSRRGRQLETRMRIFASVRVGGGSVRKGRRWKEEQKRQGRSVTGSELPAAVGEHLIRGLAVLMKHPDDQAAGPAGGAR